MSTIASAIAGDPNADTSRPVTNVTGKWRDLDAAVSYTMTEMELGQLESTDVPAEGGPRRPGERTYRFITMTDQPVSLRVTWQGLPDAASDLQASASDQAFELQAEARRFSDTQFESRFLSTMTKRMEWLRKRNH